MSQHIDNFTNDLNAKLTSLDDRLQIIKRNIEAKDSKNKAAIQAKLGEVKEALLLIVDRFHLGIAVDHIEKRQSIVGVDVVGKPSCATFEEGGAGLGADDAQHRDEVIEGLSLRFERPVVYLALLIDIGRGDVLPIGIVE